MKLNAVLSDETIIIVIRINLIVVLQQTILSLIYQISNQSLSLVLP